MRDIDLIIKNNNHISYTGFYIDHRFVYNENTVDFIVQSREEDSRNSDIIFNFNFKINNSTDLETKEVDTFYKNLQTLLLKAKSDAQINIVLNEVNTNNSKVLELLPDIESKDSLASIKFIEKDIKEEQVNYTSSPVVTETHQNSIIATEKILEQPKQDFSTKTPEQKSMLLEELEQDNGFAKQIALSSIKQIEKHIQTTYKYVEKIGYMAASDRDALINEINKLLKNVPYTV